jgi:hypothetical protein
VYFLIGRFALAQEQAVLHGVTIRDGEDVEDIEGGGTPVLTVVTGSGSRYAYIFSPQIIHSISSNISQLSWRKCLRFQCLNYRYKNLIFHFDIGF